MVAGIDLQPLSDETITQMGYQGSDLWLVRIDSIVFGPYETESLKHYVQDNEHLFENAQASRMDDPKMQPFWNHAIFQRRAPQVVKSDQHEGPFWVMNAGIKVGPLSFHDIDKKIEMNILGMTDHISVDDGETWIKIFEIEGFDRRSHAPDELPIAPLESSFHKAKLALVEKMETPHANTTEELADMAHIAHQQARVIQFKIEEMTLKAEKKTEVSEGIKWMMPTAAAIILTIATTGYMMITDEGEAIPEIADVQTEVIKGQKKRVAPRGQMPSASERRPASVGYNRPSASSYSNDSRFPTHIETHDEFREEVPQFERDPLDGPVTDAEQQPQEHSLVGNENQDVSLDAAMNGVNQPAEPVVEEVSDF